MRRRALFLDRDGVINADHGYVGTTDRFDFLPGIFPFLREVQDRGYRLVIVTNQAGVGRGFYSEADFAKLTQHMLDAFAAEGIVVDLVQACFVHPTEGTQPCYRRQSFWRKPNAGMILEASVTLGLDLAGSGMMGDRASDVQAALAAEIGKIIWFNPVVEKGIDSKEFEGQGVVTAMSYDEALAFIG